MNTLQINSGQTEKSNWSFDSYNRKGNILLCKIELITKRQLILHVADNKGQYCVTYHIVNSSFWILPVFYIIKDQMNEASDLNDSTNMFHVEFTYIFFL